MARQKLPYKEGDWIAVPLRNGGYGLGLIARTDGSGRILGYFFGSKFERLPTLEATIGLTKDQAILIRKCGDLGILRGEWPIIGSVSTWNRNDWPFPKFGRIAVDNSWATVVEYNENTFELLCETPSSLDEAEQYPEDGLSGYGALEIHLTKLLADQAE